MNITQIQPLDYHTATRSLKAIGKIFKDQLADNFFYTPIIILSPFRMDDFVNLERSIDQAIISRIYLHDILHELYDLSSLNIKFYNEIEKKTLEGQKEKCYVVNIDLGIFQPISQKGYDHIKHQPSRQEFITLYFLYEFCKQVQNLAFNRLNKVFPAAKKTKERSKKDNTPKLSFIDYLSTNDNNKSLEYLKGQFSGQKGQTIAYMVFALDKTIHVLKPYDLAALYQAIKREFGDIGAYESIRKTQIPDKGINPKQYKKYNAILYGISTNIHRPVL